MNEKPSAGLTKNERGGAQMEATSRAICKHLETGNKDLKGQCWASPVWYDMNGSGCVEFMDCPFNGDTQRCLDYLITANEVGTLWKRVIVEQIFWQRHQATFRGKNCEISPLPLPSKSRTQKLTTLEFMEP
jgi:hypothetical protein